MRRFVAPQASVSGGHVYNRQVLAAWPGEPPTLMALPGAWPDGPGTGAALADALVGATHAVVDGLCGAAHPHVLAEAQAAGCAITLLVHLPLADETGLTEERRHHLEAQERMAVQECTRVVATSRYAGADIARRHGRADIDVAPPGVHPAPLAAGSTPPQILCLAALTPRKNHVGLVRALARLDGPWSAVFAGPGTPEERETLLAEIASYVLTGRIELPGPVEGTALEALWAATDLLVLPSLAETYGLVVTEAFARGIPVVVPAGTGAVEALSDGDGPDPGLAVDTTDPRTLAHAIGTVLREETWRVTAQARRASLRSWTTTAAALAHDGSSDER
ncbi:MAG: glycosyltransferase family 4 protein [Mobilicoccus sp.]|nr:glycosyltransferase family 4 protein [Mobilicoccus sp.]